MATDPRTPQEIAYDAVKLSRAPIVPTQPDAWDAIIDILLQVEDDDYKRVPIGTLATGETLSRISEHGELRPWLDVARGDAEITIERDGRISFLRVGEHDIQPNTEGLDLDALRDLHALLGHTLDRLGELVAA
jgi:hypothetical protein